MVEGELQRMLLCLDPRKSTPRFCRIGFKVTKSFVTFQLSIKKYFSSFRYGLPVNFQAILIHPNKKNQKRLRDVLNQLYGHLDGSASSSSVNADVRIQEYIFWLNIYSIDLF